VHGALVKGVRRRTSVLGGERRTGRRLDDFAVRKQLPLKKGVLEPIQGRGEKISSVLASGHQFEEGDVR